MHKLIFRVGFVLRPEHLMSGPLHEFSFLSKVGCENRRLRERQEVTKALKPLYLNPLIFPTKESFPILPIVMSNRSNSVEAEQTVNLRKDPITGGKVFRLSSPLGRAAHHPLIAAICSLNAGQLLYRYEEGLANLAWARCTHCDSVPSSPYSNSAVFTWRLFDNT